MRSTISCDDRGHSYARKGNAITRDVENKLGVMDANAIVLCRDQGMPIRVFNVFEEGNLLRIVRGEAIGTLVS